MTLWADDVTAAIAALEAKGATVYMPLTVREAGFVTAAVQDPFGNIPGLLYNPHWLAHRGAKSRGWGQTAKDYQRERRRSLSRRCAVFVRETVMAKRRRQPATLQQLVDVGLVRLPLMVRGRKDAHEFFGEITSARGDMTCLGKSHNSLSAAAGYAKATVGGYPLGEYPTANGWPSANGWEFWEYQDVNGLWEPLDTLRDRYDQR